jgi:asparagine synthase (glutamine-hydrolysing)
VYGRSDDEDVVVARTVAAQLGRTIDAIDKSTFERERPVLTAERLRHSQRFFDGLPLDGIFNRGTDEQTRLLQVADDRLNLNGGGGEILRNFFYLPSRRYTAAEVVAAFYSGWFDEVFPAADDRVAFVTSLEDKILEALGRESGSAAARAEPLSRTEVELVYTVFRLRWWMGRNNAVAARYGSFMTPIVTPRLVKMAAAIPIAWTDGGRLEAEVITRLARGVAAGPSAYGFSFDRGGNWRHRLNVAMTLYRPVAVRHYSLKVQRMLGRVQPVSAPAEWCEALGDAPRTDWLHPGALNRLDQMNRLLTLQALAAWRP